MDLRDILSVQKDLTVLTMRLGAKKIGFADLSSLEHPLTRRFPVGISLIAPMSPDVVSSGDELTFHERQYRMRDHLEVLKVRLGDFLEERGYHSHSVGNDTDQEHLTGELSHKLVAASAGLGWVGKSSLLVTPEYGPGVRLTTLLTDAPFKTYAGPIQSQCGDCVDCVEACPAGAIKGNEWHPGADRSDLIDAFLCNSYRLSIGVGLGRKHSCGYCLRACTVRAVLRKNP